MLTRIPVARRVLTQQVLTVFIFFFTHFLCPWPWVSHDNHVTLTFRLKNRGLKELQIQNRLKAFNNNNNNNNNSIYLNTIKKFIKLYNNKIKLFLWKLNFLTYH